MKLKHLGKFAIAVIMALCFVACGSARTQDYSQFSQDETLTIAVPSGYARIFQALAAAYRGANPDADVEIISFDCDEAARVHIGLQLMAGNAPVMIYGAWVDYLDPFAARHLTDWFNIMHADPNFDEDMWFMNVFDAVSANGQMRGFPLFYTYYYIAANSLVPGLAEALEAHKTISVEEMIELHRQFSTNHRMYLAHGFGLNFALEQQLGNFFNLETGKVDFANRQFSDVFTTSRNITHHNQLCRREMDNNIRGNWYAEEILSYRYFFRKIDNLDFEYKSIFDRDTLFVNPTLLTNQRGELLIRPGITFALSSAASPCMQAMAFDFLRYIKDANECWRELYIMFYGLLHPPAPLSVNRGYLRFQSEYIFLEVLRRGYRSAVWADHIWNTSLLREDITDIIYPKMAAAGDMPMADMRYGPDIVTAIVREAYWQFYSGLVSADQSAHDLQNRITIALMERDINVNSK